MKFSSLAAPKVVKMKTSDAAKWWKFHQNDSISISVLRPEQDERHFEVHFFQQVQLHDACHQIEISFRMKNVHLYVDLSICNSTEEDYSSYLWYE